MDGKHVAAPTSKGDSCVKDGQNTRTLIGKAPNHWLHSPDPPTFDLTRPVAPEYLEPGPSACIRLHTTTTDILISPNKSALVIIDMQNFFLSPALGIDPSSAGQKARKTLLRSTIPAARKAGIQILWLNWGLNDIDLDQVPASMRRSFGFEASKEDANLSAQLTANGVGRTDATIVQDGKKHPRGTSAHDLTENGKPKRLYRGLGNDLGPIKLEDGTTVQGGRLLFAGAWNADLTPDLRLEYEKGQDSSPPDVWAHKNRMSGLWGASTPATEFLESKGLTTLLFAGVNTDQCVGGSLTDAYSKGFDCILVKDACGTTSPEYSTSSWEYNVARNYGFVVSSDALAEGVAGTVEAR